jgi:hypothetical protein
MDLVRPASGAGGKGYFGAGPDVGMGGDGY